MVRSNEDKRARRLARHAAKMQREQDKAAMYKRRREEARESVGIDMGFVGLLASIAAKKSARNTERELWREFGTPVTNEPMDMAAVNDMMSRVMVERDGHTKAETSCQEPPKDREEGERRAWPEASDAILEACVGEDEKAD